MSSGALVSPRERALRRAAWTVVAIGVLIAVLGAAQPISYGWFGWAPAEPVVLAPAILVHPIAAFGLVAAVGGAITAAYLEGRLRERRRAVQLTPSD